MPLKRSKKISLLIGWMLSIILLFGMLRAVPLKEVWTAFLQINPYLFFIATIFSSLNIWLRGGRWALLFLPHYQITRKSALSLTMISLAINAVIPGRVGEMAKIGMATKKFKVSMIFTTATVVIERLFDGLTLFAFLGLSLFYLPKIDIDQSVQILDYTVSGAILAEVVKSMALICILLGAIIFGFSISGFRKKILRALSKLPLMPDRFKVKLKVLLENNLRGLDSIQNPWALIKIAFYSWTIWFALVLCNLCVSFGMEGINLTLLQAFVVTSISVAASSIPSAPGAWGVFEAGALLAMIFLDIPHKKPEGLAFVFVMHLSQYLPVVLWGIASIFKEHVTYRNLKDIK